MIPYSEFQPSTHDPKGHLLPNRQDWLVVPVGRARDSEALAQSNFAVALERLDGGSDTVEVHLFNHWACGWFEIIIVEPGSYQELIAMDIENDLSDYPILDETDYSRRVAEEQAELEE